MEHIFLTGQIQVGKSTLINKAISAISPEDIGGFRTVSVFGVIPDALAGVYICRGVAEPVCDEAHCVGIRRGKGKGSIGFPEVFEKEGVAALTDISGKRLLLMDELGRMENDAPAFREKVLATLDGDIPVIGVIKPEKNPLLDAIRAHQRVRVIEVDEENRDSLLPVIQQIMLSNGL